MSVADTAQAAVDGCNGVAIHKIDYVAQNGFGRGGQGAALVGIALGAEVFPVGGIGIERVFRVTMGHVGTRSNQEILNRSR